MTNREQLTILKQMINDSLICDDILSSYLSLASSIILNRIYPFDSTKRIVPEKYSYRIVEIACYLYNKRGAEGQVSHNENGIGRSYESSSVPESMLKDIVPFCGVI